MKEDVFINNKIGIVKGLENHGLTSVTKKYKISYATALKWKEEGRMFNQRKPKEKLEVVS